jgi:hypothetical protein
MAKPSVSGAGTSEVWSSGEYRNYVRDMMTNFGSQYNRRREAETSASDPGRQSKGTSVKSMGQGVWGTGVIMPVIFCCGYRGIEAHYSPIMSIYLYNHYIINAS